MYTQLAKDVIEALINAGGKPYLVGGAVRDMNYGYGDVGEENEPEDYDIEVFGLQPEQVLEALQQVSDKVKTYGKSFGIFAIDNVEVSIPRREVKAGRGHKDFEIEYDPHMSLEEAASRRDFTINSMMFEPMEDELIDFFGGTKDCMQKVLRATSERVIEDPLRVYRAMQLIARFDLTPDPELIETFKEHSVKELDALPRERVFAEFKKMFEQGIAIDRGVRFLEDVGALPDYFKAMRDCPQLPKHHPEGDVMEHTLCALQGLPIIRDRVSNPTLLGFSVLFHDVGKPDTVEIDNGFKTHGHDAIGAIITEEAMLQDFCVEPFYYRNVAKLVNLHMKPRMMLKSGAKNKSWQRLSRKVNSHMMTLLALVFCDTYGARKNTPEDAMQIYEECVTIAKQAKVQHKSFEGMIKGRHLISIGMSQGPEIGEVLKQLEEMEINEEFRTVEDGLACAREIITNRERA